MINYYLITKPGIILGNLFTVAGGFFLASRGLFDIGLFFATLLGLGLIIASACICNNYIDRHLDSKMERTKNRAMVNGAVSMEAALTLAAALGIAGVLVLYSYTNGLALGAALFGFFVYIFLYSYWKAKTIYATAIGSIAGAMPPVVGYFAAGGNLDLGALLLFALLVLWQMPHFHAIAIYYLHDYSKAGIPVLPAEKGMVRTKIHMALYIALFIPIAALLTVFGYTGGVFLAAIVALGGVWLLLGLSGFACRDDTIWGRKMFRWSLVLIAFVCCLIPA
jgi:protoheme IX farnesyltransferase